MQERGKIALTLAALLGLAVALPLVAFGRPLPTGFEPVAEQTALLVGGLGFASGCLLPWRSAALAVPLLSIGVGLVVALGREHFPTTEDGVSYVVGSLLVGLVPAVVASGLRERWLRRREQAP